MSKKRDRKEYYRAYRKSRPDHRDNRTAKGMFVKLLNSAKIRNLPVTITVEEYVKAQQSKCTYCGGDLPKWGHGLDRINSSLGYTLENIVPCCKQCNKAKNTLSCEEFKAWVVRVFRHSNLN